MTEAALVATKAGFRRDETRSPRSTDLADLADLEKERQPMSQTAQTIEPISLTVRFPPQKLGGPPPRPHWSLFVDEMPEIPPFLSVGPSFTLMVDEESGKPATAPLRFEIALEPEGEQEVWLEPRSRLLVHTVPRDVNAPELVRVRFEPGDEPAERVVVTVDSGRLARFPRIRWSRFIVSLRVSMRMSDGATVSLPLPVGFQIVQRSAYGELAELLAARTRARGAGAGDGGDGGSGGRSSALSGTRLSGPRDGRLHLAVEPTQSGPPRFPKLFRPPTWNLETLSVQPLLCFQRSDVALHLELELPAGHAFGDARGDTLNPRLPGAPEALALRWQGLTHPKLAQMPDDGTVLGERVPDVGLLGSGASGLEAALAWYEGPSLEVPRVGSFFFSIVDLVEGTASLIDPTVMNDPPEDPDPGPPPWPDEGPDGAPG